MPIKFNLIQKNSIHNKLSSQLVATTLMSLAFEIYSLCFGKKTVFATDGSDGWDVRRCTSATEGGTR